jgi:hypothetical protein
MFKNEYSPSSSLLPMANLHKKAFAYTKNVKAENIKIARLDDLKMNYK